MRAVLVTGMSGTGKSTVLVALAARGHRVVDTDTDEWSHWVTDASGDPDWVWREDAMAALLAGPSEGPLFVSGCKTNQGRFYDRFDEVVLLSAPADVLLARLATRETNSYGRSDEERALVLRHLAEVEPLLRRTATGEVDATQPLDAVVDAVEALGLGGAVTRPGQRAGGPTYRTGGSASR